MSNALISALTHPDPDLSDLPEIPKEADLEESQACHLARAIVRLEASVARHVEAYKKDMQAWEHHLAALQSRSDGLRVLLKDWMIRKHIPKLSSPFVTASLTHWDRAKWKSTASKLVVQDEAAAIALCKQIGAMAAIQTVEKLIKKEFDTVANAQRKLFAGVVIEEIGEPGLTIRTKE